MLRRPDKIVGILGYGEIGKAIGTAYAKSDRGFHVRDIESDGFKGRQFDVIHVCIPGDLPDFVKIVRNTIDECGHNAVVIIHSTVPVGTTDKISTLSNHPFIVHSPVRGVHPNLYDGLITFIKYVGGDNSGAVRLAVEELQSLKMPCQAVLGAANTEMLKLLDTTYYGLCIAFHEYAYTLCRAMGLKFDAVMAEANNSYNAGYMKLGKPNVIRPILSAPSEMSKGKIGGHCVITNARLLEKQFGKNDMLTAILKLA